MIEAPRPVGRPPLGDRKRRNRVQVNLTDEELQTLDDRRGEVSRSEALRRGVLAER